MDDKNFYANFGLLNESFTLDEVEELEKKNPFPTMSVKEDTKLFNSEFREGFFRSLVFEYGYTMELLLTNLFVPHGKIFGP